MPISKLENLSSVYVMSCAVALALCFALTDRAAAQAAPDSENGRYTLSPVAGDFVRLDTRTGEVSTCSKKDGWVCRIVPDERTALDSEIGRLQAENRKLKDQLAQSSQGAVEVPDTSKKADRAPDNFDRLRTDNQKLLAMLDRIWDRLIELASQIQKKLSEKT